MTSWEISASGVSQYKIIMDATVSGTTVTVSAKWRRDSYGYSSFSDSATWRIVIDGTTYSGTWNFQGPAGGSISTKTIATRSKNVGAQSSASVSVTVDFDVSPGSGTISKSVTVVIPKPAAPSGLVVARVSDTQQTLNWTRNATYTSVVIQRSTNGGAWQSVGTASGNAYTYTDKTTVGNKKYAYRVAGVAAGGQSSWSGTATIYTSPAAPTGVSAARSGDDIVVSAAGLPPYPTTFDVQDGSTRVGTGVSLPFTHVTPDPAVPHSYTVRGTIGSLTGAWSSASNTVQLIAPPNPPSGLVPNGTVLPSDQDVVFQWVHNPVDSSPQTAFELQWRLDDGSWTTVTGTTAQQSAVTIGVGALEWQVRTKGADPNFSDWSTIATGTVIDRPGVAVVQPADTWDASVLTVVWTWFQAQSRPQSAWQLELIRVSDGVTVESRNGSGDTSSLQLSTRLTEGDWTVRARAATGDVWSLWGTETFTVVFDPPGEPVLTGVWDESQGSVALVVVGEQYGVAVLDGGVWYAEFGD